MIRIREAGVLGLLLAMNGIGYWILDIGYWILDIGYWILGALELALGFWFWALNFKEIFSIM